jgi:hypothetical protein
MTEIVDRIRREGLSSAPLQSRRVWAVYYLVAISGTRLLRADAAALSQRESVNSTPTAGHQVGEFFAAGGPGLQHGSVDVALDGAYRKRQSLGDIAVR